MGYTEVAQFKVTGVFNVTNRGKVLAGNIISGEINAGNFIKIKAGDEETYSINSVEYVNNISARKVEIGLLIKTDHIPELLNLEVLVGQTINILD